MKDSQTDAVAKRQRQQDCENMKRALLKFPSIPGDLLDSGKREDFVPILQDSPPNNAISGRVPPIYVIGENGKSTTKISTHPHIPPSKG